MELTHPDEPSVSCTAVASHVSFFSKLEEYFDGVAADLKPHQLKDARSFLAYLQEGYLRSLVKIPSRKESNLLVARICRGLRSPCITLFPYQAHTTSLMEALRSVGFSEGDLSLHDRFTGKTVEETVTDFLMRCESSGHAGNVLGLTYTSFLNLWASCPDQFFKAIQHAQCVVSFEAHHAVGNKTKQVISLSDDSALENLSMTCLALLENDEVSSSLMSNAARGCQRRAIIAKLIGLTRYDSAPASSAQESDKVSELLSRDIERLIDPFWENPSAESENILISLREAFRSLLHGRLLNQLNEYGSGKLHLFVTATPQLLSKSVAKTYGVGASVWVRVQDRIKEGSLLLPTSVSPGVAQYVGEVVGTDPKTIEELCANDRFIMEDGRTVIQATSDTYRDLLDKHNGYLPSVAICQTVKQAEITNRYLQSIGVRSVRCTSSSGDIPAGMDLYQAKQLLEKEPGDAERIDTIVLVKLIESFDCPALRAVLWYTFPGSPRISIQGNEAAMSPLEQGLPFPPKTADGTYIVEAERRIKAQTILLREESSEIPSTESDTRSQNQRRIGPKTIDDGEVIYVENAIEMLVLCGEIDLREALMAGYCFRRIPFQPHNDTHLQVLIGKAEQLMEKGRPADLKTLTFNREVMRWRVTGEQLRLALCPHLTDGEDASLFILQRIWPNKSGQIPKYFDYTNDKHLRAVLKSPRALMDGSKAALASGLKGKKRYNKTQLFVPGDWLQAKLFRGVPTELQVTRLLDRLWPAERIDTGCSYSPDDLRLLIPDANDIRKGDFYLKVFECPERGWRISGRAIVQSLGLPTGLTPEQILTFLTERLFPAFPPTQVPPPRVPVAPKPGPYDNLPVHPEMPDGDAPRALEEFCRDARLDRPRYNIISDLNGSFARAEDPCAMKCVVAPYRAICVGTTQAIAKAHAAREVYEKLHSEDFKVRPERFHDELPDMPGCFTALTNLCKSELQFSPYLFSKTVVNEHGAKRATCIYDTIEISTRGKTNQIATEWAAYLMLKKLEAHLMVSPGGLNILGIELPSESEYRGYLLDAREAPREALTCFSQDLLNVNPNFHIRNLKDENIAFATVSSRYKDRDVFEQENVTYTTNEEFASLKCCTKLLIALVKRCREIDELSNSLTVKKSILFFVRMA